MANEFNVHKIVARMATHFLKNELVLGAKCHRGYENEWRTINGHKIGDTVTIEKPARFRAVSGPDITGKVQDVSYGSTSIKLDNQITVPFKFDARGLTTEADVRKVGAESIRAAAAEIAEEVEQYLANLYRQVATFHGTPGTAIDKTKQIGTGGTIMTNLAVPKINRCGVYEPDVHLEIADEIKSLDMTTKAVSALERSKIGPVHRFDCYESASLAVHTCGDWGGGSPLVNGSNQKTSWATSKDLGYSELIVDGLGSAQIKEGDVFNIAGVYEVNPSSHKSTGRLRDFVVTEDVNASSGSATLRISPPIIPADSTDLLDQAQSTVDTAPADNAPITVKTGAAGEQHRQNLQFHKNAFSLVMRPLQKLDSFTVWEQRNLEGLSLTLSKGGDIYKHDEVWRLDCLMGARAIEPNLAVRHTS
ncbi:MAG: P22 phage major capsid protein family protein [Pseudomonadota bacterium]